MVFENENSNLINNDLYAINDNIWDKFYYKKNGYTRLKPEAEKIKSITINLSNNRLKSGAECILF